jgi:hypothetical protein
LRVATLSTPAAIVIGFGLLGVCVGAGLYLGLRERAPVAQAQAMPMGARPQSAASSASPPIPPPGAATATPTSTAALTATVALARASVESQHAALVERCWKPSVAKSTQPAHVTLTLFLDYAEDGRLAVHTLKPSVASARPDVTMCVDKTLTLPSMDPPGHRVAMSVAITLP